MSLAKQIAIVTGGSSGIGLECALHMLKNGLEKVCISDITPKRGYTAVDKITKEFGPDRAMYLQIDSSRYSQMDDLFQEVMKKWKKFDILINNAGLLDDLHWERMIAININGLITGTLLACKYIGKINGGQGGTVINLSSILGLSVMASSPVYVGTKHFVMGYSRSMGMPFNYNRYGIRVMIMCPGVTITPMITEAQHYGLYDEWATEVRRELDSLKPQNVSNVGLGVINMLKNGQSGSIWVSENDENYEVEIPDFRTHYRKHPKK